MLKEKGLLEINTSAFYFTRRDSKALGVNFQQALSEHHVIPTVEVTDIPKQYILLDINHHVLSSPDFDVEKLDGISDPVLQAFIDELNDVIVNESVDKSMDEVKTVNLVDDLLRIIIKFNYWPLRILLVLRKSLFLMHFRNSSKVFILVKIQKSAAMQTIHFRQVLHYNKS
ncbi:hypothetical protein Glove_142g48 [Diversispora epigaea]|uniref:Uncharacterized protein n=1 Tax=Diversispora epigaea TaxID=1348612 RepID=A0A397IX90_9GLOM|nr:hypothetical protein Glove_142g48 [Diversispora epigaea]